MERQKSNVGRVRQALAELKSLLEVGEEELTIDDITAWTGLDRERVRRIMENNAVLPRGESGGFLLTPDMPVDYGEKARGPHELFEPVLPDEKKGVTKSRNYSKAKVDWSA